MKDGSGSGCPRVPWETPESRIGDLRYAEGLTDKEEHLAGAERTPRFDVVGILENI